MDRKIFICSKFYTVYYSILVYRLFIFPIGVLSNILFSNESYDRKTGHSKQEEIRKGEVTYQAKKKNQVPQEIKEGFPALIEATLFK
jgi:hypothetical protein